MIKRAADDEVIVYPAAASRLAWSPENAAHYVGTVGFKNDGGLKVPIAAHNPWATKCADRAASSVSMAAFVSPSFSPP